LLKTQVCPEGNTEDVLFTLNRTLPTISMSQTRTGQSSCTATGLSCLQSLMKFAQSQAGKSIPFSHPRSARKLTSFRGFLITYMGSAAGTSPGRLVETDANYNIIDEFPALTDIPGNLNVVEEPFNPHGLTVDWNKNIILTSDFVVPVSILKPSLGIQHDNTLRLWELDTRTIISTITIPNVRHWPLLQNSC